MLAGPVEGLEPEFAYICGSLDMVTDIALQPLDLGLDPCLPPSDREVRLIWLPHLVLVYCATDP